MDNQAFIDRLNGRKTTWDKFWDRYGIPVCILAFVLMVANLCLEVDKALKNGDKKAIAKVAPLPVQVKDTVPALRYFLVSYTFRLKDEFDTGPGYGEVTFSRFNFPSNGWLDSTILKGLTGKASNYQPIVTNSIYEFKSEADYISYTR